MDNWGKLRTNENVESCLLSIITPVGIADGKFHLLPTGELLIHNLEYNDRFQMYRCRTMHRLTRQVVVSATAKIRYNGMDAPTYSVRTDFGNAFTNSHRPSSILALVCICRTSRHHIAQHSGAHRARVRVAGRGRRAAVRRPGMPVARVQVSSGWTWTAEWNLEISPARFSLRNADCTAHSCGAQFACSFIALARDVHYVCMYILVVSVCSCVCERVWYFDVPEW